MTKNAVGSSHPGAGLHARFVPVLTVFIALLLCCFDLARAAPPDFITVSNGQFILNGRPYYYIGTNYWYGPILGSQGAAGDRARLIRELDLMKKAGITNIRIFAGAEGPDNEPFRVTPTLQVSPGVYNDDLLDGLDFILSEMRKRGQHAVIYLNNAWDWSGGFSQYLNWNGYGPIPYPSVKPNTWPQFMHYSGQFSTCSECIAQFKAHIKFMLSRTNRYTGVRYTNDATIMTWEIANEPRAFSNENIPPFEAWLRDVSAYIKRLDPNHLVTTGTEGQWGCEQSYEVFERVHSDPNIDYLTMHIWPKNWSWLNVKNISVTLEASIEKTNEYMNEHIRIAEKLKKPLVLEEFGLPRDMHGYSPDEKTTCRDRYYSNAFAQVISNAQTGGVLAGCNFWTMGGYGRPVPGQVYWKAGDNYLGDPPVEEQGLNSVFNTDSTIPVIAKYNRKLTKILKHKCNEKRK